MREKYRLKFFRGRYYITWTGPNGSSRRSTGCKNEADARRFLSDWLAHKDKPAATTIGWLWDAYVKEKDGKPAVKRMASEWKSLAPFFEDLEPDHITVELCRKYADARRDKNIKDGTIWTELGDLATVMTWAKKRRHIQNAPHIERPPKPPAKGRWLTEAEIQRLIKATTWLHIKLAIQLMLSTAGRKGAVLELTWDRVDLTGNTINLAVFDGKRRKGRAHVPMTRTIRTALLEAKEGALTDYVIEYAGRPVKDIKRGFAASCAIAGLDDVTPHTLRHTAAVHMAKRGVSMAMIAQYLGHEDDRITQRVYARFAPGHMAEAANALDGMFG